MWWAVTVALFLIETLGSEFAVAVRCISMSLLRGMSIDCCCLNTLLLSVNIGLQALFMGLYIRGIKFLLMGHCGQYVPMCFAGCSRLWWAVTVALFLIETLGSDLAIAVRCKGMPLLRGMYEHRLLWSHYVYQLLAIKTIFAIR